ncbi:MAG: DUF4349 domain-containing protein [archaeon]
MSVKDQFVKLKENWLLIVILLVIVVIALPLLSGVVSNAGSGLRYSSSDYSMSSSYNPSYNESYSKMASGNYLNNTVDFAPGVTDRLITKNASLSSEVKRGTFETSQTKLIDSVTAMDAYLLTKNSNRYGDRKSNQYYSGYYTIKVETKKYSAFVDQLKSIGNVTSFNESTDDVTGNYTNLSSEISAEQEKLTRYKVMFAEATLMEDKITLTDRIAEEQRTIDYLKSALENVNNQVSYSTINVSLTEEQSNYANIAFVKLSDLVRSLVNSSSLVLRIIFFLFPFGVLALIIWGIVRITRRKSEPVKTQETIKRR